MAAAPSPLPIDAVLPELIAALGSSRSAVLRAPTGAGKTTRVPPALLDAGLAGGGVVVMLEPRRIAARAAARRMAAERGAELGGEVGYQVRFDRRAGPATRILVVTEGILVQRLQADPFLDGVGAVIFDELHERRLDSDLALAMTRRVQREVRPELVVVAMSATLDAGPVAEFLGGCPVVESTGALHPVAVEYLDPADRRLAARSRSGPAAGPPRPSAIAAQAARGALGALDRTGGDVLVFLPGVGEIRRTAEMLAEPAARRGIELVPLYGDLPPAGQDAALRPGSGRRVVLATNVAETSITVEGVGAVVDTGWARQPRFDPASGLDRLELVRISRASADQRAGRAGRLGPGLCLRLWTEHDHAGRAERETPEIARVDLAGPALQLLAWGETDLAGFGWLEPPAPAALARARALLADLGAVDAAGVTALGRELAALPAHPRLARLLVEAARRGARGEAALAAALLAERSPFAGRPGPGHASASDLLDRVDALAAFERGGRSGSAGSGRISPAAARFVLRARDQLAGLAGRRLAGAPAAPAVDRREALGRAVLAGWPDRVARRRAPGSPRAVMVGGGGVRLAAESAVREAELFVAVEVGAGPPAGGPIAAGPPGAAGEGTAAEPLVRTASAIEPGWLPADRVSTAVEVGFDAERERVVAHRRTRYRDLVIDEREVPAPAGEPTETALAAAAAADLDRALGLGEEPVASLLARLSSLAGWRPELELPVFDAPELRALLPALCRGRRSFDELRRAPLAELIRGALGYERLALVDREAPERLEVPSGSRVRLAYEPGRPPVLAVRIQELFGLAATPRVADGRVPVLLHLLAPNGRPQQVTDDLAGFWERTYPEVRRELAGRYPKHAWPADPRSAVPESRPRRRR